MCVCPELHVSLLPKEIGGFLILRTCRCSIMGHNFSLQGTLLSQTAKCAESVQNLKAESAEITELFESKPLQNMKSMSSALIVCYRCWYTKLKRHLSCCSFSHQPKV